MRRTGALHHDAIRRARSIEDIENAAARQQRRCPDAKYANSRIRSYGKENWQFDADGLTRRRIASINDLPISANDRKFHWPPGQRPDDNPGLSALGL